MKCVHCNRSRGKRFCPAKNGDICPRCCGEYRGIEINCPPDCEYFIEGQKNHQQRIAKLRVQKEGPRTYIKRAELYTANPEMFALIEKCIASMYRSNRRIDDKDLETGLEQVCSSIETEIKGIYYEYESENSYANEISHNVMTIVREGLQRYSPKSFNLEISLDIAKEFLNELRFYIEYEPDKQSYIRHITRYHPEEIGNKEIQDKGSSLIIT